MAKGKHVKTTLDRARDELYSHIHRCGVLEATEEQQQEWMADTLDFLEGRYPELSKREISDLRELGLRFCKPVIPHGRDDTAPETEAANTEPKEAKAPPEDANAA